MMIMVTTMTIDDADDNADDDADDDAAAADKAD